MLEKRKVQGLILISDFFSGFFLFAGFGFVPTDFISDFDFDFDFDLIDH